MPFFHQNGLKFFCFGLFDKARVVHGVFTKHGGVSPTPWASLNIGGTVGDSQLNVIENRKRMFDALGRKVESIYDSAQVQGSGVRFVDCPRTLGTPHLPADALLTDVPSVTLMLRFADCVPVLMYDPHRHVVGLIHTGWKGTILKLATLVVRAMRQKYHSDPSNILAGIGPAICTKHFEIGPEIAQLVANSFSADASSLLHKDGSKVCFDLCSANQLLLEQAGVRHIEQANICTCCHREDWYSYRGDNKMTGNFGAVIALTCK